MANEPESMDRALNMAEKFASKIEEILEEYGPDAVELTEQVGRVGAIDDLVPGLVALIIAIFSVISFAWVAKRAKRADEEEDASIVGPCVFAGMIAFVASLVSLIVTFGELVDVWAWVGLAHPEVWLASKMLGW